MAGLFSRFLDYIGIEDAENEEEEYMEDIYNDEVESKENVLTLGKTNSKKKTTSNANVVSLPNSGTQKMIVYHPISYEDTQNIIDNLKSRKPVIVNMEELELDCAQRILDFMAGAVYALNGTIYRVSRGIFTVAPNNYDVIGNDEASDYSGRM